MPLFQRKEVLSEDESNIKSVYKTIWSITQLKSRVFSPHRRSQTRR